jgi:hypothetical protein
MVKQTKKSRSAAAKKYYEKHCTKSMSRSAKYARAKRTGGAALAKYKKDNRRVLSNTPAAIYARKYRASKKRNATAMVPYKKK